MKETTFYDLALRMAARSLKAKTWASVPQSKTKTSATLTFKP